MSAGKKILIGLLSLVAIGIIIIIAVFGFVLYAGQDPKNVAVSLEGPHTVKIKEDFTITVVVQNQRKEDDLHMTDVDVAEEYIQGFLILDTDPKPKSSMHVPVDNKRSYTFDQVIKAGETARFEFHLRPKKAGLYQGEIDVCEGVRFLTAQVQTLVEEEPSGSR
jgi:hypothetical protein